MRIKKYELSILNYTFYITLWFLGGIYSLVKNPLSLDLMLL